MSASLEDSTLVDVEKIQRKLNANKDNPYSIREGSCHVPVDASAGLKKSHLKSTADTFLSVMSKRGYELSSRLSLLGPFEAVEIDTSELIPDKEEWRIRGVFKKDKPDFSRIELDPAMVKQGDNNG